MTTRRDCIQKVYQKQLEIHGEVTSHLCVRRLIREEMLAAGLSLSPLPWTSTLHPKPWPLYMKYIKLKSGTVQQIDYDQKMKQDAEELEANYKAKYRRTRQKWVQIPCHQWIEDGPKFTLLALAKMYAGAQSPDDPIYHRIKERYLDGASARDAVEREAIAIEQVDAAEL